MGLKGNSQCTILCHSQVLVTVPLRALLDQFASDFPSFCKVGTGHNKKIDFDAKAFIAVTDSVHLLKKLKFDSIFCGRGTPSIAAQNARVIRVVSIFRDPQG